VANATELLERLVSNQALTNPDLAEKQLRLIGLLRAEAGSDQEVLTKLFAMLSPHRIQPGRSDQSE
jgi:hypothetical protein